MKQHTTHIFPDEKAFLSSSRKEELLQQKGVSFWFTGLSGAGKTTLAKLLENELHAIGYLVKVLDGDNIRDRLNTGLGFSEADRSENIRRVAEVARLFNECGVITLNTFVSPLQQNRNLARQIIGAHAFVEVYINATLKDCEARDVKGLYKKARNGEIADFTGVSAPFEAPHDAAITICTSELEVGEAVQALLDFILTKIKYD